MLDGATVCGNVRGEFHELFVSTLLGIRGGIHKEYFFRHTRYVTVYAAGA